MVPLSVTSLDHKEMNEALHNMGYYQDSNPIISATFKEMNTDGHAVYECWFVDGGDDPTKCKLYVSIRDGKFVADF